MEISDRWIGDLVGLLVRCNLAEANAQTIGPRTDQVKRFAIGCRIETVPDRLAVDMNALALEFQLQVFDPVLQTDIECCGIQSRKDTPDGIVRGDIVFQMEERLEPINLLPPETLNVGPGLGATDGCAEGDDNDFVERVLLIAAVRSRIG